MEVSSVTQGTGTATTTEATGDRASLGQDFDQFLRLLTTQLQNQDPLNPMSSTEFTTQLVQFSAVEQAIKQNDSLEKLLAMQTLNLTALGLSFIGKDVEVQGNAFKMDGIKGADIGYVIPEETASGTISILDKDSNVVFTQQPDLTPGRHTLEWDGKDANGNLVPAGDYTIRVAALTDKNKALNVTTFVPGFVDSLESADNGDLLLIVNDQKIPLTDVRKVSVPRT